MPAVTINAKWWEKLYYSPIILDGRADCIGRSILDFSIYEGYGTGILANIDPNVARRGLAPA